MAGGLPVRGERYRGPSGAVEVVEVIAVDAAIEGVVLVKPAGAGSQVDGTKIPLPEFRREYVYAPESTASPEVQEAARQGFESRPPVTQVQNPAQVEER